MVFNDALMILLSDFDVAVANLRKIHEDTEFTNNQAPQYREAIEKLVDCQAEIFKLKEVWVHAAGRRGVK